MNALLKLILPVKDKILYVKKTYRLDIVFYVIASIDRNEKFFIPQILSSLIYDLGCDLSVDTYTAFENDEWEKTRMKGEYYLSGSSERKMIQTGWISTIETEGILYYLMNMIKKEEAFQSNLEFGHKTLKIKIDLHSNVCIIIPLSILRLIKLRKEVIEVIFC